MAVDELQITTSLDQYIPADASDALAIVDEVMSFAIEKRNAEVVAEYCKRVLKDMKVKGLTLAKLFYLTEKNWNEFGIEDNFYDTFFVWIGVHQHTITRYVKVWKMLMVAPPEIADKLKDRNIKDLIPIGNAIARGYQIEDEDWDKIANSADFNELSKIVREDITGQPPRKSGLTLVIDRDGDITAWHMEEPYYIGHLDIKNLDEVVEKAVERIIKNSGMIQK